MLLQSAAHASGQAVTVERAGQNEQAGGDVTVEGLWSKRSRTTKDGQPRVNDVLTVRKIRLLTETEVSAPDVDDNVEYDEATPEPSDLKEPAA
jgi:hypothetical protein